MQPFSPLAADVSIYGREHAQQNPHGRSLLNQSPAHIYLCNLLPKVLSATLFINEPPRVPMRDFFFFFFKFCIQKEERHKYDMYYRFMLDKQILD